MKCDKWGEEVPRNNDATIIECIVTGNRLTLCCNARHFLPTAKCEGSPSRAQYIKGQKKDTRGDYPYDKSMEKKWRRAFKIAQRGE